jgi:hypothetical protein
MKLLNRITFRKLVFILILGSLSFSINAQENEKINVDFYGFVRVDAYMDTYKGQDLGHDIFYLLPQYAKVGDVEVNNQLSSNISAIASRLGVKINSDDVLNAKLTGVLEFDFAGNLRTDPTMFRIRQAFSMLSWEKSSLLMGQTWHPFFGAPHMPVVAGLNTGAPFHAFNRSPMIRYKYNMNSLSLTLAAVSEMQYATRAADYAVYMNTNNHAKRNGIVPELVLTADWSSKGKLFAGAGVEHKIIKPRMVIENGEGVFAQADEFLSSTGFVGYARYKGSKFSLLFKAYFGENMSHLVMPGGYGVAGYDPATGRETYTNYKHYTAMMSAVYGKEFQLGLFAAYGQNLGTSGKLHAFGGSAKTYGLFLPIQDMMRIAPHIAYNKGKLRFVAELESTIANYGQGNIRLDNGLYDNSVAATNNRLIFTMTHYF